VVVDVDGSVLPVSVVELDLPDDILMVVVFVVVLLDTGRVKSERSIINALTVIYSYVVLQCIIIIIIIIIIIPSVVKIPMVKSKVKNSVWS